jgi:precorrin-6B methylase 1
MTTSYVHVNSANRDMIAFPSGNAYSVYLPNPVKNVTQVEIITARIPNTIYNLTSNGPVLNTLGKNGVLLPSGFYSDPAVLATELTNRINGISSPDYNTSQSIYTTITINNLPGGSAIITSITPGNSSLTVYWSTTLFPSETTLTVWYSTDGNTWTAFSPALTCGDGVQTITDLTSGTIYYVALVVTGDPIYADYNTSKTVYSQTNTTIPGGSATITSITPGNSSLTVYWSTTLFPSGTTLTVWYSTDGNTWTAFSPALTCGDGVQTITDLTSGTTYYVALVVTGDPLYDDYNTSKTVYSQTNTTIPGGSATITSINRSETQITVNWTTTLFPSETTLTVWYSTSPSGPWIAFSPSSTCGAASQTITGLTSGTTYYVALVVTGDPLYADYNTSKTVYSQTNTTIPGASLNFVSATVEEQALLISWTNTLFNNSTSAGVVLGYSPTDLINTFNTTCGALSYNITGLASGQNYYVALVANGDPIYSDYNGIYNGPFTPSGGTAIITSITPGNLSLTVYWSTTLFSSGTTLTVWYSTDGNTWTAFSPALTCGDGAQTITGLTNGTPYYVALVVTGDPVYADYNTSKTVHSTQYIPFTPLLLLHADGDLNDSSINNFIPPTIHGLSFSTSTVKFGSGSIYFNGNSGLSSYLAYSHNNINFPNGVDFSIECWMYPTASGQRRLFGGNQSANGWQIALWDNQTFNLYINNGGGEIFISPNNSYTLNTWQHMALCRTGNTIYLFINGNLIQTASMAGSMDNGYDSFYIGTDGYYNDPPNYQGYIDEFRIIRGLNLYTTNFTPQTQPFTPPNRPAGTVTITSVTPGNRSLTVYWSTTLFSSGTTLNTYYSTDQNTWYTFGSGTCGDGSKTIPYLDNGTPYYLALVVIGDPVCANYNVGKFIINGPYSPSSGLIFTCSLDSVTTSPDLRYYQFNLTLNMPDTNTYYVFVVSPIPNVNYLYGLSGYQFSGSTSYSDAYNCYSNHGVTPPEIGVTYSLPIYDTNYNRLDTLHFSY